MIQAYTIESLVVSEIGAPAGLTTNEQERAVKEVVSDVVYQADSGKVTITFVARQGEVSSETRPPTLPAADEENAI
jgi:hypothetical protein